MASIPKIDIDLLPEAERPEAKHLSWLLALLDSYRRSFEASVRLIASCRANVHKTPYSDWHDMAIRDAALSVYHFRFILNGISHSLHLCPSIEDKLGKDAVRNIGTRGLFKKYFPQWEDMRNAVGHAGEIQHTRKNLDAARFESPFDVGGVIVTGFSGGYIISDQTIYMSNKKQLVSLEVSPKTHEHLKVVVDAIHDLFRPISEKPVEARAASK